MYIQDQCKTYRTSYVFYLKFTNKNFGTLLGTFLRSIHNIWNPEVGVVSPKHSNCSRGVFLHAIWIESVIETSDISLASLMIKYLV